jgi:hypothetical protein
MSLTFERGNPQEPRGHALVYFRAGSERVLALYIIVLPVSMDISKYIPPLLAPQFGGVSPQEMSAVALPPVPEDVGSYEELVKLAEMREDDLILGGTVLPSAEPTSLMEVANSTVQEYAQLWADYLERTPMPGAQEAIEEEGGVGVSEVLFSLMGERDKLAEMSKLVSRLRFAVEGHDSAATKDAEEEIQILSRYLPDNYLIAQLLDVALRPQPMGGDLAQLYLERCYRLSDGDEEGVRKLEERIKVMESSE